jgi:hypothetical protein
MFWISIYILYILERLSLAAPCEYVHPGLVSGLDWALHQLTPILHPYCLSWPPSSLLFVPTIHISHKYPSLTTKRLNTIIQVNNMGMQHLMYNRHIDTYIHHIIITVQYFSSYFFYTSGQASWPRTFMSGTPIFNEISKQGFQLFCDWSWWNKANFLNTPAIQ